MKEFNSQPKKITTQAINFIKDKAVHFKEIIQEKIQEIKMKIIQDKENKKISKISEEEYLEKLYSLDEKYKVLEDKENKHWSMIYKELDKMDKIESTLEKFEGFRKIDIRVQEKVLLEIEKEYKGLGLFSVKKHSKLSEKFEKETMKLDKIKKHNETYEKVEKLKQKLDRLTKIKDKHLDERVEITKDKNKVGDKISNLKELNAGLVRELKQRKDQEVPDRIKEVSMSERIAKAKVGAKERNEKEKPKFSIESLRKTQKEIDRNRESKPNKTKKQSKGMGR